MTLKARNIATDKLSTRTRILILTFSLIMLTVLFEILLDMGIFFTTLTPKQVFQSYSVLTVVFIGTGFLITALIYRTFSDELSLPKIKQVYSNHSLRKFWPTIMNTVFILLLFVGISTVPLSGKDMLLIPVAMAAIIENINSALLNLSGLVIIENSPEEKMKETTWSKSSKSLSAEDIEQLSDDELEQLFND